LVWWFVFILVCDSPDFSKLGFFICNYEYFDYLCSSQLKTKQMKETTEVPQIEQNDTVKDWFKKLPIWKKMGLATIVSPFYFAYRGFIASTLYGWLVLPIFPTMPNINMWQAAGLILLIAAFSRHSKSIEIKEEFTDKDENLEMAIMVAKPFFVLIMGYLLHLAIS
jgi:hypothetical protein